MTTIQGAPAPSSRRRSKPSSRPVWMEKPNVAVRAAKAVALGICVLLVIVPFWSIAATSLADQQTINDSAGGMVMWPDGISLDAYSAVLVPEPGWQHLTVPFSALQQQGFGPPEAWDPTTVISFQWSVAATGDPNRPGEPYVICVDQVQFVP